MCFQWKQVGKKCLKHHLSFCQQRWGNPTSTQPSGCDRFVHNNLHRGEAAITAMQIIPVIDIMRGIAVHARRGERMTYRPIQSVLLQEADPVALLGAYRDILESKMVYIADLDAIMGKGENLAIIAKMAASQPQVKLLVDAGIRSIEQAKLLLDRGVKKVVIASESLVDLDAASRLLAILGTGRALFSIDLKDRAVIWRDPSTESSDPCVVARRLLSLGCCEAIFLKMDCIGYRACAPPARRRLRGIAGHCAARWRHHTPRSGPRGGRGLEGLLVPGLLPERFLHANPDCGHAVASVSALDLFPQYPADIPGQQLRAGVVDRKQQHIFRRKTVLLFAIGHPDHRIALLNLQVGILSRQHDLVVQHLADLFHERLDTEEIEDVVTRLKRPFQLHPCSVVVAVKGLTLAITEEHEVARAEFEIFVVDPDAKRSHDVSSHSTLMWLPGSYRTASPDVKSDVLFILKQPLDR